jgi:hypothetical protein
MTVSSFRLLVLSGKHVYAGHFEQQGIGFVLPDDCYFGFFLRLDALDRAKQESNTHGIDSNGIAEIKDDPLSCDSPKKFIKMLLGVGVDVAVKADVVTHAVFVDFIFEFRIHIYSPFTAITG